MEPNAITQERNAITQEPTVTPQQLPTAIAPKLVSKPVPNTVTKDPNRVAAGKRTAELMRQRKTEMPKRENNLHWTTQINEPWLTYALGGAVIVGVILCIKKCDNKTIQQQPTVQVVPQTAQPNVLNSQQPIQKNLFHME